MKFICNLDGMESNRKAVATCRAELEIAENLAEALKHEIEVRECHLKMAQATLNDEALVYCERKVRKYRPELGTCDDEHWKVVKDWTGMSIVEVQPEAEDAGSHEQEVANLKEEVAKLKQINDSLRQENLVLKAQAKHSHHNHHKTTLSTLEQPTRNLIMDGSVKETRWCAGQVQDDLRSQSKVQHTTNGCVRFQEDGSRQSGHRSYGIDSSPDAIAHARAVQSFSSPTFESQYGITATQALGSQGFSKLIEVANFHFIITAVEPIPTEIFQERTGGTIDCGRFRELFVRFIDACRENYVVTDEELERCGNAHALYLELRNSGGRAMERYEILLQCEREFL